MTRYIAVVIVLLLLEPNTIDSIPVRLTIECSPRENDTPKSRNVIDLRTNKFNINSFCDLIHDAIPKAVKDGKFIRFNEEEKDQIGHSNDIIPFAVLPPKGFIPDLKFPRLKKVQVPKLNVPKLRKLHENRTVPKLNSKPLFSFKNSNQEETSAEKMEKFKKGVHKMLHVVKVLGQIDQYLSERTRIVVDKLAKTLSE